MLKNIISTLFTKGVVAIINLLILLISSKQLGGDVRGQVSLIILNIAIIQIITEIYTGSATVYFISKQPFRQLYNFGTFWAILCTFIIVGIMYLLYIFFDIGIGGFWLHLLFLSFLIIQHSFHMVVILAKEKIKLYNFLNLLQPFMLLLVLLMFFFLFQNKNFISYIYALYISFGIAIFISSIQLFKIYQSTSHNQTTEFHPIKIIENGFYNQLANLSHILSNRYNFYLLGNTVLVGVYSSATSLIESLWIISGSASPIILAHIANEKDPENNARLTLAYAKICFLLSLICVICLYFIPRDFFVFLLGQDFIHIKTVMLYLSPGVLCISFATIISHYYSGLGKQKILLMANSTGFLVTICLSKYLISKDQLLGASYTATLSYATTTIVLVCVFLWQNKFRITDFFNLKQDVALLKKH